MNYFFELSISEDCLFLEWKVLNSLAVYFIKDYYHERVAFSRR